jgi:hypothetical protein
LELSIRIRHNPPSTGHTETACHKCGRIILTRVYRRMRIRSSYTKTVHTIYYVCNREGAPDNGHTARCMCPWKNNLRQDTEDGYYKFQKKMDLNKHNHPFDDTAEAVNESANFRRRKSVTVQENTPPSPPAIAEEETFCFSSSRASLLEQAFESHSDFELPTVFEPPQDPDEAHEHKETDVFFGHEISSEKEYRPNEHSNQSQETEVTWLFNPLQFPLCKAYTDISAGSEEACDSSIITR